MGIPPTPAQLRGILGTFQEVEQLGREKQRHVLLTERLLELVD